MDNITIKNFIINTYGDADKIIQAHPFISESKHTWLAMSCKENNVKSTAIVIFNFVEFVQAVGQLFKGISGSEEAL